MAILAGGFFWGYIAEAFLPTPLGGAISGGLAVVVAATAAIFAGVSHAYDPDNVTFQAVVRRSPVLANTPFRMLAFAAIVLIMTYFGTSVGFLDWWTLAFGHPGELTVVADYETGGRRACSGFRPWNSPPVLWPPICASYDAREEPPPGSTLVLSGQVSAVGIHIDHFRVVTGAQAQDPS
jgi:hypothetical protein